MRIAIAFIACALSCTASFADPPKIANEQGFVVPLADGSKGSAMTLAAAEGQILIVAAKGDPPVIALYRLAAFDAPEPGPGPEPKPDPEPGPNPDPQPNPRGPVSLIWIEETADRTPEQAAALTDAGLRDAIRKAGWSLRIADMDVVDEQGNAPADLAAHIAAAKRDGVPRLFAVDAAGAEVFAGKAPANKDEFAAILKRLGLSLAGEEKPKYVRVIKEPEPKPEEAKDCPTGNCPVPQAQSQPQPRPRIRLFR